MKKVFAEFKKFITRGNVIDLAVGVIIGSAFTAIVTALTNNILKPLINGLLYIIIGQSDATAIYTFLVKEYDATGAIDLAKSIYIDWGALINSIINFLLIAIILFVIVKIINSVKESGNLIAKDINENVKKKQMKLEMKKAGLNYKDKAEFEKYCANKILEEERAAEEAAAKQKAEEEEAKRHTTEGLLEEIKALFEKQAK